MADCNKFFDIFEKFTHFYQPVISFLFTDEGDVLQRALEFKVDGKRKKGRPKVAWKEQVEREMRKIGLRAEDAQNRERWRENVKMIGSSQYGVNPATSGQGDKTGF